MTNMRRSSVTVLAVTVLVAAIVTSCGSDETTPAGADVGADRPVIAVTTSILGDVVGELVGDEADVVTIMGVGADPHDFQASAKEVDRLLQADAVILNGAGFEAGLLDVIDSARGEGVPTFEATDAVETIQFGDLGRGHRHDDESGHEGEAVDDAHDDESGHDGQDGLDRERAGEAVDPHFFTDPGRMADAVRGIATFLEAEVSDLDEDALDTAVADYLAELADLDAEVDGLVAAVPEERRVLVTNHEVFGYFADRYGFEVVGVVIPGGTTVESASAGELADLAQVIESEGVPAIFADTSSSNDLADTLAAEAGDVAVVELYTESLGEPGSDGGTYIDMVRTNAIRISEALA